MLTHLDPLNLTSFTNAILVSGVTVEHHKKVYCEAWHEGKSLSMLKCSGICMSRLQLVGQQVCVRIG